MHELTSLPGSYGSVPLHVTAVANELNDRLERNPDMFMRCHYSPMVVKSQYDSPVLNQLLPRADTRSSSGRQLRDCSAQTFPCGRPTVQVSERVDMSRQVETRRKATIQEWSPLKCRWRQERKRYGRNEGELGLSWLESRGRPEAPLPAGPTLQELQEHP